MYSIPSETKKYYYEIEDFKGVDFTSSPLQVDKRRSPNAKNIINNNGFNETRNGYNALNTIGTCINGVWNIDTTDGDLFLVHSGTKLYQCSSDFSQSVVLISGMSNNRSKGVYFKDYLLIFDGVRTVVFSKFDGTNYQAKFLDTCGYIPVTSVARDRNGGGTAFEKENLISPYQVNTFLTENIETGTDSEGNPTYTVQTKFILNETNIESIELVQKLTDSAEWENIDYTADLESGTITCNPGLSPVLGSDNLKVMFKKTKSSNSDKVNKCDIVTLYGYEGNNNRIFISGNPDLPNYDYWCEQDNPLYWPDENFAKIGIEPIVGYSKLTDGTLAIQKKHSDTDNTVYYRSYNLLNSVEVFPLQDGVKNIGCISKYANANLLNDPLTLTEQGVFAIVSSGIGNEKYAMQRSYYVNGKLLKENDLENAIGIAVDGKYYIGINNHVYIADSRYLSYPKNAKTEQYQYEWYYWENIPARVFFSWNNKLYFGTSDGKICGFTDEYLDISTPIDVKWETPFLNANIDRYAKTIKRVDLFLNPGEKTNITLGYELDDGENEIITKLYENLTDNFPKTISEKERIKKFMFVKFYMKNNTNIKMSFERLGFEYVLAGRYKGE